MMKRFKFLGALFVGLIGLISFGNCWYINASNPAYGGDNISISSYNTYGFTSDSCFICQNYYCPDIRLVDYDGNTIISSLTQNFTYCTSSGNYLLNRTTSTVTVLKLNAIINGVGGGSCPDCPTCDEQFTSQECQEEYSLMPISSCNSEYCNLNGLCMTGDVNTGSGISDLYINGINHLSAPIINVLIPYDIEWNYLLSGNVFELTVGSGNVVDTDYIDNIIRTQNSKPTETDFNNIVSVLIPKFVPGLVIILFILFIFRFIKKIF